MHPTLPNMNFNTSEISKNDKDEKCEESNKGDIEKGTSKNNGIQTSPSDDSNKMIHSLEEL